MSYKQFRRALKSGLMTRRAMLAGLAAAGIVATTTRRMRAAEKLNVFTWAGYDDPHLHQAYIEDHGESPTFTFFGEVEEGLQKLRGGFTPDIAHPCTSSVSRWNDAGVLRPIDPSKIEHWNDIFPSFRTIRGVTIGDEIYNMPFDWGNESVLYRTDLVTANTDSLALLTDETYRGRIAMFDSAESMSAVAGVLTGAETPYDMTDEEIARAHEVMKQINANVRFYWTDATQITQALGAGELVAAWAWNAAVVELKNQGLPVAYMEPKEGLFTWVCGLSLVKDGPGAPDDAYDFLNAMLEPETGRFMIEEYGYGHSNQKSFELVPAARLEELGIANVKQLLASSHVYEEIPPATKEKLIRIFDQVKAGL